MPSVISGCSRLWRRLSVALLLSAALAGCSPSDDADPPQTIYLANGGRVKTLDPALAEDLASRNMVAAIYDTLLQYDYTARPYRLIPSMLQEMPQWNADLTSCTFTLRDDLYFTADPCFGAAGPAARKITSGDVVYSLLRIADGRTYSPVFWMFRGKITGIDAFREKTLNQAADDFSAYDAGIPGLEILDDRRFVIHLDQPDPRFLYNLAIPYAAVVSRRAVEFYGEKFAEHPVGSGPFRLQDWLRDYRLVLDRNPDYRLEYYPLAADPADREKALPLSDRIVVYNIKQPLTAWLLFLQGNLDMSKLDKDNFDIVVGGGRQLAPALVARGVELLRAPEFEIQYVGFNFTDPVLGKNLWLRRAIAAAYNIAGRVEYSNYQMLPTQGPVPPGVAGCDPDWQNPYQQYDLEKARHYLQLAGYPGGVDPATGEPLTLSFDQNGNSALHRQMGEMMVSDMAKIGIRITANLNNSPRFFQKLRQGQMQLFRLSWIGDYPDAENFLQLFYSPNAGGSNRTFFRDPEFDRQFEAILKLPDGPERTERYETMVRYLAGQNPWIFETLPLSYQLKYRWLENFELHDFAFNRWKYLAVDAEARAAAKKTFRPLSFRELAD